MFSRCFLALLALTGMSFAQTETPNAPATPAPKPWVSPAPTVEIWPDGKMPGKGASAPESEVVRTDGFHRLTNVSSPTLTLFPAPRKQGAPAAPAMIVCPGGGYGYTVIDKEGTEIAAWLNSAGFSALVLKYRTPNNRAGALQDAQRALSLARERAAEWNIDPKRVGIMGFSAGGNLAAKTSAPLEERSYPAIDGIDKQSCRPDFAVLVYPAYLDDKAGNVAPDLNMKAQFPPLLIIHTDDDKTHVVGSKVFDAALTEARIAHDFKLYPTGGHGYGLHCTGEAKAWTDDTLQWLQKVTSATSAAATKASPWETGKFRWTSSGPLIDVEAQRALEDPHVALKDPAVVFHDGRWHVFATLRMKSGRVCMQYINFTDWAQANTAPRETLSFTSEYHCAPQVFYFAPHRRWYLIYQLVDPEQKPPMGPYFSTTENIADPKSWTKPSLMVTNPAPGQKWIDFWVICDAEKAHLFYTSNNGKMWRRETKLSEFPYGWSEQTLALEGDIFEASHTYKLQNRDQYLTIIEAQAPGRRYYKAYVADRLDGPWKGLADSLARPFAAQENVVELFVGEVLVPDPAASPVKARPPLSPAWTTSFSHGELLRTGSDERMEVDPEHLKFLYQGVREADYRGSKYGGIPWRLGLLEMQP